MTQSKPSVQSNQYSSNTIVINQSINHPIYFLRSIKPMLKQYNIHQSINDATKALRFYLAPDLKGATSRSYHDSLGGKPAVGFLMVEAEPEEEAPPLKPERPDPIAEGRPAETPGDIRSARRGRSRLNREPEDIGSSLSRRR